VIVPRLQSALGFLAVDVTRFRGAVVDDGTTQFALLVDTLVSNS